jgi:hypothetical protein
MTRKLSRFAAASALPALVLSAAIAGLAWDADAAPIFSQTPTVVGGLGSDRDYSDDGSQAADNFTLAAPATVRSVTWRGIFIFADTPVFPLSFDLYIYGNTNPGGTGDVPDTANVLSTTTVTFSSASAITDTGLDAAGSNVYEFRANVNPTALSSGTSYWFSPLADSTNDDTDDWLWGKADTFDPAAVRTLTDSAFTAADLGPFYFVLDDAPVPEPSSIGLLTTAALGLLVRRRSRHT